MTARIYDRPDHDQQRGRLPLRITGTLPNSAPFVAYENRLQIHNAIGACRAELFAGDLPAGYTISVDNETQEIIVAWPAWEPVAQPVFNGDFEMGDVGWEKGAGWAVRHNPPEPKYTGNWAAIFTGGGTSSIMCVPQPCGPGRSISGGVLFDQGSSNKKNVDCYVQLSFYDVSGKVIGNPVWGNKVHKLTNKQRHWSRVTHTSPPQTAAVSIGAMVHRRRYLRPVSADDIYWNLEGSGVGAPEDATYEITIRAFDSAGRSALWSGEIAVRGISFRWYVQPSTGTLRRIPSLSSYDSTTWVRGINGIVTAIYPGIIVTAANSSYAAHRSFNDAESFELINGLAFQSPQLVQGVLVGSRISYVQNGSTILTLDAIAGGPNATESILPRNEPTDFKWFDGRYYLAYHLGWDGTELQSSSSLDSWSIDWVETGGYHSPSGMAVGDGRIAVIYGSNDGGVWVKHRVAGGAWEVTQIATTTGFVDGARIAWDGVSWCAIYTYGDQVRFKSAPTIEGLLSATQVNVGMSGFRDFAAGNGEMIIFGWSGVPRISLDGGTTWADGSGAVSAAWALME